MFPQWDAGNYVLHCQTMSSKLLNMPWIPFFLLPILMFLRYAILTTNAPLACSKQFRIYSCGACCPDTYLGAIRMVHPSTVYWMEASQRLFFSMSNSSKHSTSPLSTYVTWLTNLCSWHFWSVIFEKIHSHCKYQNSWNESRLFIFDHIRKRSKRGSHIIPLRNH